MPSKGTLHTVGFLPCQVKLFSVSRKWAFVKHTQNHQKLVYCITPVKCSIKGSETQTASFEERRLQSRRAFVVSLAQLLFFASLRPEKTFAAEQNFAEIWTKRVFPKAGYNSPESLTFDSVERNMEAMKDPQVQKGIENLKAYRSKVSDMCDAFEKNPQMEIQRLVRDNFNIAQLRDDLNKVRQPSIL